jgi:hypothetical protein
MAKVSTARKWARVSWRALGFSVFGIIPIVLAFNVLQINLPKIQATKMFVEKSISTCLVNTNNSPLCGSTTPTK